jgi:hypothetical protein
MQKNLMYKQIREFLISQKIRKASIFGSFARNEETATSDIDLLIEGENLTLFDVLRLEDSIQKITNRKVDIVEYDAIKPSLQKYIQADLISLI